MTNRFVGGYQQFASIAAAVDSIDGETAQTDRELNNIWWSLYLKLGQNNIIIFTLVVCNLMNK